MNLELELEFIKLNTAFKKFIKDQSKEKLKRRAQIPFEKLKEHYQKNF